jgi:hypothetical protein
MLSLQHQRNAAAVAVGAVADRVEAAVAVAAVVVAAAEVVQQVTLLPYGLCLWRTAYSWRREDRVQQVNTSRPILLVFGAATADGVGLN